MMMEYGGEKNNRTVGRTRTNVECEVLVVQDPERLKAVLRAAGLDERNDVAVKAVTKACGRSSSRRRVVVLWFDGERPATYAAKVADSVAQLRGDGDRAMLDLSDVEERHRSRIVVAVAKACLPDLGSLPPVKFYAAGSEPLGHELERICRLAAAAAALENEPSNAVGPAELAERAIAIVRSGGPMPPGRRLTARVLTAADLGREKMGLLLGVGRGGEKRPCMAAIELRFGGGRKKRPIVALVGKGVTFDSGGLAIKSLNGMYGQHGDKTGATVAASVLAYFATAKGTPPFDLVALLPAAENLVSAASTRPGDVHVACDGQRVEVVNPDAEGRLLLADAIAYAGRRYAAHACVDFATLTHTGALVHPDCTAVYYTQDEAAAAAVQAAGEETGERVWRMPPWSEYDYAVRSLATSADLRNSGWASHADGYMAALFLRRFLPASCGDRWLHVDISKNEATGTQQASGSGPFVGAGVALGVRALERMFGAWSVL